MLQYPTILAIGLLLCATATSIDAPSMSFGSPTTGADHTIELSKPENAKGELRLAIYAYNGQWAAPGALDPAVMREQLQAKGYAVGLLDYGGNQKAVMPDLFEDGRKLAHKKTFGQVSKALGNKVGEIFVIPAGYTISDGVHFYTSPDNGLEVFATVVHPIAPPQPVPLMIRYNSAGAWSGSLMAGTEFRGYARAWVGHPFNFNQTKDIFPKSEHSHEKNLAYAQSAVRTLRARASEFNIDPQRIGAHGASKHGNISVWAGVTADHQVNHERFGGLHPEASGALQFIAVEATFGFAEHLQEDKAPKDVPKWMGWDGNGHPPQEWLLERSWSTYLSESSPAMAITRCHGGHWRTEQVKRLIRAADALKVPLTQSLDEDLPHYNGQRGRPQWYALADQVLKPVL